MTDSKELMDIFITGEKIARGQTFKVVEQKKKTVYAHYPLNKLKDGCPIDEPFSHCIHCDYTDIIGYCCHPIKINEEIEAGRAQPFIHDFSWGGRDRDFKNRSNAVAFRAVDKR